MNFRAQLVRRLAGDFVQRLRIALGSSGDDAAQYVDRLDRGIADDICGSVCEMIGVPCEAPEPPPQPDGKPGGKARAASPWKKQKFSVGKGSERPGGG